MYTPKKNLYRENLSFIIYKAFSISLNNDLTNGLYNNLYDDV